MNGNCLYVRDGVVESVIFFVFDIDSMVLGGIIVGINIVFEFLEGCNLF